jgi:hypothetical protein
MKIPYKGNDTNQDDPNKPWLDLYLSKEAINHLWDSINTSPTLTENTNAYLAGNISKSNDINDKNNWFYKNVLKRCVEKMYYKDWHNYYNIHIAKIIPPPEFILDKLWVNYQKQHEFNPPHNHSALFSFVVFMKIPTHWEEQHALPRSANSNSPRASNFQFQIGENNGFIKNINITLGPEDEGRMLFFPAWLYHQVFPFYGTEEERITISGNIVDVMYTNPKIQIDALDKEIENLQKQKEQLKQRAKELKNINFHIK